MSVEKTRPFTRWRRLHTLERRLELPMVVLGFVWLALLVIELTWGLVPALQSAGTVIWVIFIGDFLLRLWLAPDKLTYLRRNLLTLIALLIPALRVFRLARALRLLRYTRGVRLVRVITSLNRGMRALGKTMRRRGFGYMALLTVVVVMVSAAGMYAFEYAPQGRGLSSYFEALWWTAMLVTTLGSEYWPQSVEGRVLSLLLSLYAIGLVGYMAGALASFFIDQDAAEEDRVSKRSVETLRAEIAALRQELEANRNERSR
jgi:voltage-gated potassium channel